MTVDEPEGNEQIINVEVKHVKTGGDTFQQFLDLYESSAKEVQKHKYARWFYWVLTLIGLALFSSEILSVYGGNILAPIFPGVETQADFSYAPYGPILGICAVAAAYPIYSYSKSLNVNPSHRSFYLLADSIEHYQNEEYDESLEDIEELVRTTSPRSDLSFHLVRYNQIEDYVKQLNAAEEKGQLAEAMEKTYSDVFEPICAETILLFSQHNPVSKTIDNMDYVSEEYHPAIEVLTNSFSQVNFPNKSRIFTIVIIGVVALVIGFTFGTQWAVLLLTIYMIYAGSGISTE